MADTNNNLALEFPQGYIYSTSKGRRPYKHNLVGRLFGRLTVIERAENNRFKQTQWRCRCECGREHITAGARLLNGQTKSCGCLGTGMYLGIPDESGFRQLVAFYKRNAATRGHVFALDNSQVRYLTSLPCKYCGALPSQESWGQNDPKKRRPDSPTKPYVYNGIDRLDNTLGYTMENCAPCCGLCNRMKSTLSADDFVAHCKRIASR